MKLYLAGNFVIMGKEELETKFRKTLGDDYHRLCAFFYREEADVLMSIKEKEINNEKNRTFKRTRKNKTGNSK